ncbi:MAG: hypothetical protein JXA61_06735 [Bacteroidales bacterium]|nr:hypothetical protein [Bacteroidales bacterium]
MDSYYLKPDGRKRIPKIVFFLFFVIFMFSTLSFSNGQNETNVQQSTSTPKYFAGASVVAGFGFDKHALFYTSEADSATLSPGGGGGLGIIFGFMLSKNIELDFSTSFQSSSLSKNLKNADAKFSRYYINSTLFYVFPSKNKDYNWKIGGGPGYYIPGSLNIEWTDMTNVADGDLKMKYKGSIGFHVGGEFEMLFGPPRNWSLRLGLTYYYANYKYSSSAGSTTVVDPGELQKLNGSTFNFNATWGKYF